jgi:hypothetical protein
LPGYPPELNPQEEVWNLLKRVELKHLWCLDLSQVAANFDVSKNFIGISVRFYVSILLMLDTPLRSLR